MPYYAKFIKDIISKKKKLDEGGVVGLYANCSPIIQKNLLRKGMIQAVSPYPAQLGTMSLEKLCVILVKA